MNKDSIFTKFDKEEHKKQYELLKNNGQIKNQDKENSFWKKAIDKLPEDLKLGSSYSFEDVDTEKYEKLIEQKQLEENKKNSIGNKKIVKMSDAKKNKNNKLTKAIIYIMAGAILASTSIVTINKADDFLKTVSYVSDYNYVFEGNVKLVNHLDETGPVKTEYNERKIGIKILDSKEPEMALFAVYMGIYDTDKFQVMNKIINEIHEMSPNSFNKSRGFNDYLESLNIEPYNYKAYEKYMKDKALKEANLIEAKEELEEAKKIK